jgi:hypothetical protein
MYPTERYMKTFKGYVRKMAQLNRSMAMGYAIEELLGFCT